MLQYILRRGITYIRWFWQKRINLNNLHHAFCIIKNPLSSILKSATHQWSNTVKIRLGLRQFLLEKGDILLKGGFIFNVLTQWWITIFLGIKLLLLRWLRHVILMISCKFLGFPVHILASSIDEVSPVEKKLTSLHTYIWYWYILKPIPTNLTSTKMQTRRIEAHSHVLSERETFWPML